MTIVVSVADGLVIVFIGKVLLLVSRLDISHGVEPHGWLLPFAEHVLALCCPLLGENQFLNVRGEVVLGGLRPVLVGLVGVVRQVAL
jgi:hypothetical protein